ncbi:MAG: Flp pilus assembly protein CpaB [Nitrospirota bacterium]
MVKPKTTAAMVAVAALFLASLAAYSVYSYLHAKEQEAMKAKMEVQKIVVAASEIPFGSKVQPGQLKMANWPKNSMPPGCAGDQRAFQGRLAVSNIPAGSPVIESCLAPESETGVLSYIIPSGHRAITVAVNEVVGVAGFVLPNSIVDVVATVNSPYGANARISKIILQNVRVLAVGQILEQKEGKPVSVPTVTLDVAPGDAEKLALASENKVQLILRHMGDKEEVKTGGATVAALIGASAPVSSGPVVKRVAYVRPEEPTVEVIRGDVKTNEKLK